MPPVLELNAVCKTYGDPSAGGALLHALRGVSLRVDRGEFVAIVGASGSGKSTLLNVLGTLDRPTEGHYAIAGIATDTMDDADLARLRNQKLGFIFQSFQLLPRETALENVMLPLVYARVRPKERRERALQALQRVGLADRSEHLPTQLSGGQQQRVAIARALVTNPEILLADEPTGALDSTTTAQILALLSELHDQGQTLVLVTHDPKVASIASRLIEVSDGLIVRDVVQNAQAPAPSSLTQAA